MHNPSMHPDHDDLTAEVELLRSRLAFVEARLAGDRTEVPRSADAEETGRSSRRGLLRLAGAAVVGGAAAAIASAQPAAAISGNMQFGSANNAGSDATLLTSSSSSYALQVTATDNNASAAIRGIADAGAHGVYGRNDSNAALASGVLGATSTTQGYGVTAAGGKSQLYITPSTNIGPSSSTNGHNEGEVAYDLESEALWVCVASGGAGTWRKLAGFSSAGAFHAISPGRAYDSRKSLPGPKATLATGASRTVSVANKYSTGVITSLLASNVVPVGATAVAYNITVVNTVGNGGYLAVNEGGNTTMASSIINWATPGQVLANSSVVKLNGSRQITVICGGTATSCDFIIDTVGYYL